MPSIPSHGWLPSLPSDHTTYVEGVEIDRPGTKTRLEEFSFLADVARQLEPGYAWDAGTGYIRRWHVAPEILAALDWHVLATDTDARSLAMPCPPFVVRLQENMVESSLLSETVDLVTSISVIEHCGVSVQEQFADEVTRVAKPGATLVLTADGTEPAVMAEMFERRGWQVGEYAGRPTSLTQPIVGWLVARKAGGKPDLKLV